MTKSKSSSLARLVVAVVLIVAVVLVSTYFFISSSNNSGQANDTESINQTSIDESLDTVADNSVNSIKKELDALAEDDYSDNSLSDTALYE